MSEEAFARQDWQASMQRDLMSVGLHSRISSAYAGGVSSSWQSATQTLGVGIAVTSPFAVLRGRPATAYGHLLAWGSSYTAFRPLWPWAATELFGSYKGEKYGLRFGFGYKEHVPAGVYPGVGWLLRKDMERYPYMNVRFRPVKHPWRGVPLPLFGFGFESVPRSKSRDSQVRSLPSKNGGSRPWLKLPRSPSATIKQGGKSPSIPRGGTEGSRPSRRGSRSRRTATSRTVTPMCPVHNVRHWCNVTRAIVSKR